LANSTMIVLNKTETKRLIKQYTKQRMGLVALAEEWGYSVPTIRRLLVDAGVTIRPRGRPANTGA